MHTDQRQTCLHVTHNATPSHSGSADCSYINALPAASACSKMHQNFAANLPWLVTLTGQPEKHHMIKHHMIKCASKQLVYRHTHAYIMCKHTASLNISVYLQSFLLAQPGKWIYMPESMLRHVNHAKLLLSTCQASEHVTSPAVSCISGSCPTAACTVLAASAGLVPLSFCADSMQDQPPGLKVCI